MTLTSVKAASAKAQLSHSRWLEIGHASAHELEKSLGRGEEGDFLPGLGELTAWGLSADAPNISGALVTKFLPAPESVSIMMTALAHDSAIAIEPLSLLTALPKHCFETLTLRSWLFHGPAITILDRGRVVLQTRSRNAAMMCRKLLAHLVRDAEIAEREANDVSGTQLFVKCAAGGIVSDFRMIPPPSQEADWLQVKDWA